MNGYTFRVITPFNTVETPDYRHAVRYARMASYTPHVRVSLLQGGQLIQEFFGGREL